MKCCSFRLLFHILKYRVAEQAGVRSISSMQLKNQIALIMQLVPHNFDDLLYLSPEPLHFPFKLLYDL